MDSCILIDDISDHLPIMLCMDLFLTTSRVSILPLISASSMIRERMLLDNYYNLLISQLLNKWLTLEVLMLPMPHLLVNINRYNVAFPITTSAKVKNLTVPNNPGCLQPCINHVVRNQSSIKKILKTFPLRIGSNSNNREINSSY